MKRVVYGLVLVGGALSLTGLSGSAGSLIWTFLHNPYTANYDGSGVPLVIDQKAVFSAGFENRVVGSLPEGHDVRNLNPAYIASDNSSNLYLLRDTDLWLNFLHEGAGYRSSLGYFTYTAGTVPQSPYDVRETIVFPNSSFYNSGGSAAGLHSGDSMHLGHLLAGTYVGFVLVSNGWNGTTGVKRDQSANWIFYSLPGLNPETNAGVKPHTVVFYDAATQKTIVGFEDWLRSDPSCDHDFNDVMFTVTSNPADAVNTLLLQPVPPVLDRDLDGLVDSIDAFPDDPLRAYIDSYPSKNVWGTVTFEDQWPKQGDYDMNDLTMRYQVTQVVNSGNQVKDIQVTAQIQARGASVPSGFGIELTNVVPSSVESATMTINNHAATVATPEAGQKYLTWIFFENDSTYAPTPAGYAFYNTEPGQPPQTGTTFTLKMIFRNAQSKGALGLPPYNPFIFNSMNRGVEVHLPDRTPTQLADASLFGTADDNSNPSIGRYYKTSKNLPWALLISENWHHPTEKTMVTVAYPDFALWAQGGGKSNLNWYLRPNINPVGIYPSP